MYSPKIKETLVKELYQLKLKVNKPMTRLVNKAVQEFLNKQRKEIETNGTRS